MATDLSGLIEALSQSRSHRLRGNWTDRPRLRCWASDLHDCKRHDVLAMIAWESRQRPAEFGLGLMEEGNSKEDRVISQLQAEGWKVTQQQTPFEIKGRKMTKVVISGRIDGMIGYDEKEIPLEIKDTNEWTFRSIDDENDLQKTVWLRKWYRQIQVYMIGHNHDVALLVLCFRGDRKYIAVHLDYDKAEVILQRAEDTVKAHDDYEAHGGGMAPDEYLTKYGLEYETDSDVCLRCPFFERACFPPTDNPVTDDFIVMDDLKEDVARMHEIQDVAKEHEQLKKKINEVTKGKHVIAGKYLVSGKWTERRYTAKPAKEAYTLQIWRRSITKLEGV